MRLAHTPLQNWAARALVALGTPAAGADAVARSLVESELRGHASHGVRRLVPYAAEVRAGTLDPAATPVLLAETRPAAVIVDGHHTFGQLTAQKAVDVVVERAGHTAMAAAVLRRCRHVGRLGEYVEALAAAGFVGIGFANADPTVAPWGGRERLLGTNPTAWAVPVAEGAAPLVVDFATAGTAEGKLAVSRARGEQVATGLLLDRGGHDSTDPEDFYDGGALLPLGGHKGYGLGVAFDLVAGLLSGARSASDPAYAGEFGTVLLALDVAAFTDLDGFVADVEAFRARVRDTPPRPGVDRVLVPGEPEWAARTAALREGIALAPAIVTELDELARSLDVPPLGTATPAPEETS